MSSNSAEFYQNEIRRRSRDLTILLFWTPLLLTLVVLAVSCLIARGYPLTWKLGSLLPTIGITMLGGLKIANCAYLDSMLLYRDAERARSEERALNARKALSTSAPIPAKEEEEVEQLAV